MFICSIEFDRAINIPVRPTPALVSKTIRRFLYHRCFEKIHIICRKASAKGTLRIFYVNFKKFSEQNFQGTPPEEYLCKLKSR